MLFSMAFFTYFSPPDRFSRVSRTRLQHFTARFKIDDSDYCHDDSRKLLMMPEMLHYRALDARASPGTIYFDS